MSLLDTSADPPHVAADRLLQIIEARFGDGLQEARPATASGPIRGPIRAQAVAHGRAVLVSIPLAGNGTDAVSDHALLDLGRQAVSELPVVVAHDRRQVVGMLSLNDISASLDSGPTEATDLQ